MTRLYALLVWAALLAGPAVPALAGPVITVTDVSVVGDAVTITGPIKPVSTIAGPITLKSSFGTLVAWCVDLYHDVYTGGGQSLHYQVGTVVTDSAPKPTVLTQAQLSAIARLAQYGQSLIGTAQGTADALAAVQLAIWTTEYADFSYTGAEHASVSKALAASASFAAVDAGLIALDGTQTFVTASPAAIAAVPAPAGLAVLCLGVPALLAAVRQRRRLV